MFFCSGKFVMEQINNFFSILQNKKILFDQVKNIWTGYQVKKYYRMIFFNIIFILFLQECTKSVNVARVEDEKNACSLETVDW